jgi:hypothetical protein
MTTDMFPGLFSFMPYHRVCTLSNTTGATSGAGTVYSSGSYEFTPSFSGIRITRSLDYICCDIIW